MPTNDATANASMDESDDSNRVAPETPPRGDGASRSSTSSKDRDKVAEFCAPPTSEVRSLSPIERPGPLTSPSGGNQVQTIGASSQQQLDNERGASAVILATGSDPEDPPWKSSALIASPPVTKPAGTGGGRRLTFADETGGVLAEVSYSNRTHYSKQAGPSTLGGAGRACCTIS